MKLEDLQTLKRQYDNCNKEEWTHKPAPKTADGWSMSSVVMAYAPGKENAIYCEPDCGLFPSANGNFVVSVHNFFPALYELARRQLESEAPREDADYDFGSPVEGE